VLSGTEPGLINLQKKKVNVGSAPNIVEQVEDNPQKQIWHNGRLWHQIGPTIGDGLTD
jgi:hypothetical protein